MIGVNRATIAGNVGQDATIRYSASGVAVATFSIATNRLYKNQEGERQEETEWHRVVVLGKMGERAGQLVKKGAPIFLEGRISTKDWEDKEGRKRRTTEIIANTFSLMDGGRGRGAGALGGQREELGEGDIPF